jgi:hypothetical protein
VEVAQPVSKTPEAALCTERAKTTVSRVVSSQSDRVAAHERSEEPGVHNPTEEESVPPVIDDAAAETATDPGTALTRGQGDSTLHPEGHANTLSFVAEWETLAAELQDAEQQSKELAAVAKKHDAEKAARTAAKNARIQQESDEAILEAAGDTADPALDQPNSARKRAVMAAQAAEEALLVGDSAHSSYSDTVRSYGSQSASGLRQPARATTSSTLQDNESSADETSDEASDGTTSDEESDSDDSEASSSGPEEGVPSIQPSSERSLELDAEEELKLLKDWTQLPFGGSVTFEKPGELGVKFKRYRNSKAIRIISVDGNSQAAEHLQLRQGLVLRTVQGDLVDNLKFSKVLGMLGQKQRPLQLTFALQLLQSDEPGSPLSRETDVFGDTSPKADPQTFERDAGSVAPARQRRGSILSIGTSKEMDREERRRVEKKKATLTAAAEREGRGEGLSSVWTDGGKWMTDTSFPMRDDFGRAKDNPDYGQGTPLADRLPARRKAFLHAGKVDKAFLDAEQKMKALVEAQAALRHTVTTLMRGGTASMPTPEQMKRIQQPVQDATMVWNRAKTQLSSTGRKGKKQAQQLQDSMDTFIKKDESVARQTETVKDRAPVEVKTQMAAATREEILAPNPSPRNRRFSVSVSGDMAFDAMQIERQVIADAAAAAAAAAAAPRVSPDPVTSPKTSPKGTSKGSPKGAKPKRRMSFSRK